MTDKRGIKNVLAQVDVRGQVLSEPKLAARQEGDLLEIYLYDDIEPDGIDDATGEVIESQCSADGFKRVLDDHPQSKEVRLFVNSRGGYVKEAMGMRAHLLRHKGHKVAYVDGYAASAASLVITACDEIKMLTGSMQMLHSMWVLAVGNAADLRKAADDLDHMMVANRQIYLERAGEKLTEEKLLEIMDEERWLNPSECLELGLADKVLSAAEYKQEAASGEPEAKTPDTEQKPEEINEVQYAQTLMAALLTAAERTQSNG